MSADAFLLAAALVCFLLGAFAPPARINVVALGLACWVATLLF